MSIQSLILEMLHKEVAPAMGCTEPVAIALAVSKARELAGLNPSDTVNLDRITLHLSPNVFKNGLAVGIPGTSEVGLMIAAGLGHTTGESAHGLELFKTVTAGAIESAKALIATGKVSIHLKDTEEKIWIEAWVEGSGRFGHTILQGRHDQFIHLSSHEGILHDVTLLSEKKSDLNPLYDMPLIGLIRSIESIPHSDLSWLLEGIDMNRKVAEHGIHHLDGMGVGHTLHKNLKNGLISKDLMGWSMTLTASASDARMAGVSLPVMSSNGSGNNGLTALLPLAAYADLFEVEDQALAKAAAISHTVNSVIKHHIGRLSALCGCGVAAGTGAAVAIAWLMHSDDKVLDSVIQNMIANTTGMVCDGAKVGCALKLATSASAAVQSALLAVSGVNVPSDNGIIGTSCDESLANLAILSKKAMPTVDRVLLEVMLTQSRTV